MTQTTEQVGQSEEESYLQKRKTADDYYRAPSQWKNILTILREIVLGKIILKRFPVDDLA